MCMIVSEKYVSHPFGQAAEERRKNIWEIYECEIILGNKHKSTVGSFSLCVHIFFLHYFSRFCRTTPDSFGSLRRHIRYMWGKKSSTVLLLFLNPLAFSITCWVRECETSFSDFGFNIFFLESIILIRFFTIAEIISEKKYRMTKNKN
jgi:hypothetical protein